MKIIQSFTSVAYPQANGQTEVTNRIIVQALKARLHGKGKDWVEELPSELWAYRTTPRSSTRETPYSLVYGSEAVLPVEIGQSSTRVRDLVMKKIKSVGDVGKLEARWEGPFKVIRRISSGAAYYLENSQGHTLKRPWNAFHLMKYYV
ncbi:uncharacterized protein LOC142554640 [Primulina tabacum]|uniref:uncharacterized protein LOC142554640 n=1 Tax=Primulina tabacum TaxID=48773 RepID=UPI003F59A953